MTVPTRRRTRAREIAMQALFQFDLRGSDYAAELGGTVADICRAELRTGAYEQGAAEQNAAEQGDDEWGDPDAWSGEGARQKLSAADREILKFATRLVEGTLQHRDEIDARLQTVTRNWDLRRMAIIDRNVLRMATFELMFCADVPPKVVINEAIEIGKKFSTANTGAFVNGILDRIRIDLERGREASGSGDGAN